MNSISIKVLPAGAALSWYKKSWSIFFKRPGLFMLQLVIFSILQIMGQALGPLSSLFSNLVWCFLGAGFVFVCDKIEQNNVSQTESLVNDPVKVEAATFADFLVGFNKNTKPLVILGLYLTAILIAYIAVAFLMVILIGGLGILAYWNNFQALVDMISQYFIANILIGIFIFTLAILVPMAVMMMLSIFSPILVFFHDMDPAKALKISLNACAQNSMVFLMHGIWFGIFSVLALIPLGLGFLVLIPVSQLTMYFAYKDIFQVQGTKSKLI